MALLLTQGTQRRDGGKGVSEMTVRDITVNMMMWGMRMKTKMKTKEGVIIHHHRGGIRLENVLQIIDNVLNGTK